jgi:DNA-binding SARP family transcriptional activator/Tfp pilus assembly protein PilF
MEFRILGAVEVRRDDEVVSVGGAKPRAILAVLLLHANQAVSAGTLALVLWGEDAAPRMVRAVQVHVSRLRKALADPDVLVTTPAGYVLRVRPGELDADRFQRLMDDGRRRLAAGRAEAASAAFREALSLWRGQPLAELGSAPFARPEIGRLEEQRLIALEARVEADISAGRHVEVVGELQQLVAEHPLREHLHALRMLALYRTGRQADALEAYRHTRALLVEELGIEPGPELRDLHQAMLAHDPALAPPQRGVSRAGERPPTTPVTTLARARDAVARHAWGEAHDLLATADAAADLSPEDLELLAAATFWSGPTQRCVDAHARAYSGYMDDDDRRGAARVAVQLALEYATRGSASVAAGWLKRAERLLEAEPECPEQGYFAYTHARFARAQGDLDAAFRGARRAAELGRRFGHRELEILGVNFQGYVLLAQSNIKQAWALIDEASAAAIAGELAPIAAGIVFCHTISACRDVGDFRRAAEWTDQFERWCDQTALPGFPSGDCRVHRAEVLRVKGEWEEAEREARLACDDLLGFQLNVEAAEAFYEIGEIRRRVGDEEGAEDAFRRAHELGWDPQPGLALLMLGQGKTEAARRAIERAVSACADCLSRMRLLPVWVDVTLAAGEPGSARTALTDLESIAADYGSAAFHAAAAAARGSILLAEGDAGGARKSLQQACRLWQEVRAPYEAARARTVLAEAYRAEGDEDAAELELRAAEAAFIRLGAMPDAHRAAELAAAPLL